METVIGIDDPHGEDVGAVLAAHLAFTRGTSPAEFCFALDVDALAAPGVTFFSARRAGRVVAVAALKELDAAHAELKSMHTLAAERKAGIGRSMVDHLLGYAREQGYKQVSLETGTTVEFAVARALYENCGFVPCDPFGDYAASDFNTFMTLMIDAENQAP